MQILTKSVIGRTRSIILLFLILFSFVYHAKAQLIIKDHYYNYQAISLIQKYFANSGIRIDSAAFIGALDNDQNIAIGSFSGGENTNLGINEGIVISTGNVIDIPGSANDTLNINLDYPGFPPLSNLLTQGSNIADETYLFIKFTPFTDSIKFSYVFASEEFPPYNDPNDSVKDVFGFFITGANPLGGTYDSVNLAKFPGTNIDIKIDSFAHTPYDQYYIPNNNGSTIKFDGFTKVLTAVCHVIPCQPYTLIIAVGDANSPFYDSGIFLEAGSLSSTDNFVTVKGTNGDDGMVEKCGTAKFIFHRETTTPTPQTINFEISGTATNGLDYTDTLGNLMPNSVTFLANQAQTELMIMAVDDTITEPTETIIVKLLNAPSCGIDTAKTILYLKNTEPLTVKAIGDTIICFENVEKGDLTAIVNGGVKPYKYQWYEDNQITTNEDTTEIHVLSKKNEIPAGEEKPFYLYHVVVIDSCKTEITSNDVTVFNKCPIKTTNVFTPNGDGFNDKFIVKNLIEYPNSTLLILNRWGRKVYETNNYQNDWDGKNLADGVYYFIIKLPDGSKYQGSVTILR